MSFDSDALAGLDDFFGDVLAGLSPAQRKKGAQKLGMALRRSNLKRQQQNVAPDGSGMEPRKPRLDRRGGKTKKGKMFRRLRFARHWKIEARSDSVEIEPKTRGIEKAMRIHHFGLTGMVGRDFEGKVIRVRYPERQLLGFSRADEQLSLDVAKALIDPDS